MWTAVGLFGLTAGAWTASLFGDACFCRGRRSIRLCSGSATYLYERLLPNAPEEWTPQGLSISRYWWQPRYSLHQRNCWLPQWEDTGSWHSLDLPLWPLAAICAAGGLAAWRLSRPTTTAEQCRRCGYLLAGLPEATPCPECGRQPG